VPKTGLSAELPLTDWARDAAEKRVV
jgi:hypothetical protein